MRAEPDSGEDVDQREYESGRGKRCEMMEQGLIQGGGAWIKMQGMAALGMPWWGEVCWKPPVLGLDE